MERKKAKIVLEDGKVFTGFSFGYEGEKTGEIIFNTSLTGYQEILTDPSYKGQIVVMTYPLIGNYGINKEDIESFKPQVEGFVVKEYSKIFSNWRAQFSLDEYLKKNNIIGIENIDTRELTKHIREKGAMKGIISTLDLNEKRLWKKSKNSLGLVGQDLVKEVTCKKSYKWGGKKRTKVFPKVAVIDCGVKYSILRELDNNGCEIQVLSSKTSLSYILKTHVQGILLSNGPGDPRSVIYLIETVKELIEEIRLKRIKLAIFGICLGHQILALSLGGKIYKLKFGHHGGNHPVKILKTGKVDITVQNHGFCVDINSLEKKEIEITHLNLNDNTIEGIRHKNLPIFSVQFHPEASPGPTDSKYLFAEFMEMMEKIYYAKTN